MLYPLNYNQIVVFKNNAFFEFAPAVSIFILSLTNPN